MSWLDKCQQSLPELITKQYRFGVQLKIYRWLIYLAGPFIDLYLISRKKIGKEDDKRFPERLGRAGFPRPAGSLVWIHAASVGEAISVLPLINSITDKYKKINVLLTTGTVTSAKILEQRLPSRTFHQYIPIDKMVTVRRFLEHWKPDLALWVESELWPNLIIETHKTGCQMIQINARLSENSYEKWKRGRHLAERMLRCFALSLVQSEDDGKRLADLGAKNVKYIGNLKFDAPPLPSDPKETGNLLSMIGERHIWLAASTHKGEELIVANTHKKLKETYPDLLTIIAPRHPQRCEEICQELADFEDMEVAVRTKGDNIKDSTDIYIADSVGELGIFFRLTGIVFMGGSLVDHGGQNPLEAARLECAIITGPHIKNFAGIYKELKDEGAYIEVNNEAELVRAVSSLLSDHEKIDGFSTKALELVESKQGIAKNYINEMKPFFKPLVSDEDNKE